MRVTADQSIFLTVGIGASAGGLEAFKSFFAGMPADTGMAFVLVQHLSPDHKSILAELVGKATPMKVIEAVDGDPVVANCVFVIPPDATMTISRGVLQIVQPAPPRDRRRPIDTFFVSLAQDQGDRAVCIILSGTGSDGAIGLTAVKEHGGLTLAQAEYDSHAMAGMPESAANTGLVDEVLAVEAMAERLIAHQRHLAGIADGKDEDGVHKDAVSQLASILRALHARTGHDFSEYKEKTLVRRLQRRMQVLQVDTPQAYRERLRKHPEELDLLMREMLISVTHFFRDPASFDVLNETVLKPLMASRNAHDDVRIWVPGCATGEETYTIAMLLREAMATDRPRPKVQIFSTDLDDRAVAVARLGRYRKPIVGLSPERLERWFTAEGDEFCINPEIREMCIFSAHSVIKHPPFSRLDLISCRNLLIYLDPAMQDRLMRTFHYALNPNGRLFLGSSESATRAIKLFAVRDKKHRIFERRDVLTAMLPPYSTGNKPSVRAVPVPDQTPTDGQLDKYIRQTMEKHAPPYLLLDRANRIVRFSGGAVGPYLEPSPGPASFALFDILRKALRPAARDVLQQVRMGSESVHRNDVPIRIDGTPRLVSLIAERLNDQDTESGFIVLAVHDSGPGIMRVKSGEIRETSAKAMQSLEQELQTTRSQLQSTIDELETANEEMKSSNEEYQSVNEELQSSNEELETAKEEMQSVNEELQTINTEMASKNDQLTQLNSDLSNLLESTEIATLFLDENLRVRRFTRGINEVFHLRTADIGRPITEIVSLLDYRDLQQDVKLVLRKLASIERQVTLEGTRTTFILRIRPYRTTDNVIDGAVLTFVDITDRQIADEAVRLSETKFRMLFDYIDEGFCILEKVEASDGRASDYRYLVANPGFEQQSGIVAPVGKTIGDIAPSEARGWCEIYDHVWHTGESIRFEREFVAEARHLDVYAFRFAEGSDVRLGAIFRDVSDRKRHDEQQELLLKEMDHRIKNLFAIAESIVSLSVGSSSSPKELAATIQGRLAAMASAHDLVRPRRIGLTVEHSETTLAAIVETLLRPHASLDAGEYPRLIIEGPEVHVSGDAVASLAMVLHEFSTNAVKYGALSVPGGCVHVTWTFTDQSLVLTWVERGGPPIKARPESEGFGSLLAQTSVTGQLDGQITYDWDPQGVTIRLSASQERLSSKSVQ